MGIKILFFFLFFFGGGGTCPQCPNASSSKCIMCGLGFPTLFGGRLSFLGAGEDTMAMVYSGPLTNPRPGVVG